MSEAVYLFNGSWRMEIDMDEADVDFLYFLTAWCRGAFLLTVSFYF